MLSPESPKPSTGEKRNLGPLNSHLPALHDEVRYSAVGTYVCSYSPRLVIRWDLAPEMGWPFWVWQCGRQENRKPKAVVVGVQHLRGVDSGELSCVTSLRRCVAASLHFSLHFLLFVSRGWARWTGVPVEGPITKRARMFWSHWRRERHTLPPGARFRWWVGRDGGGDRFSLLSIVVRM